MSYMEEPRAKGEASAFTVPFGDSSSANVPSKPKDKKPYLVKNTGLQTRLLRSREKK